MLGIQQVDMNMYSRGDLLDHNYSYSPSMSDRSNVCDRRRSLRKKSNPQLHFNFMQKCLHRSLSEDRHSGVSSPLESNLSQNGRKVDSCYCRPRVNQVNQGTHLGGLLASVPREEEDLRDTSTFDLGAHEEEVKPTLDGKFESFQLGNNPIWSVNIGLGFPLGVRSTVIEYL